MTRETVFRRARTIATRPALLLAAGLAVGATAGAAISAATAPTEHKGLEVVAVGAIPEASMDATIGLAGYKLQLRAITIDPGGQIASHSHGNRPGLVKVISGEWVEGRDSGESVYSAGTPEGIVEDENTVHWFFNRGDVPATAIVCDIVPEG